MKARLGMTSIVLGVLSIAMVYAANHYESFRGTGSSYLLNAADRAGLVRTSPVDAPVELKAPGLLAFTDETALQALLSLGVSLAAASICLALFAEYRHESNLYLSAGFICGSGGLFLMSPVIGLLSMAACAVVFLGLRHARKA
jgi:hypothetical protein